MEGFVQAASSPSALPLAFARDTLRPSFAEIDFIDFRPSATALEAPSRGEIRWSVGTATLDRHWARNGCRLELAGAGGCLELRVSPLEGEVSRSDRGGYASHQHMTVPGKNITWR